MSDPGLLAQRLRWARSEQGITLQQLSERTGRAVSYLSQLEHGVRTNPTKQTVDCLAAALHVSPAFLFGEVPEPAPGVGHRFRLHLEALSPGLRTELAHALPEARFREVALFLVMQAPAQFSHLELAFQLGLSTQAYEDLLNGRTEASHPVLERLSALAGIPLSFLIMGEIDLPASSEADRRARYDEAVAAAMARNLSPERLLALIRAAES